MKFLKSGAFIYFSHFLKTKTVLYPTLNLIANQLLASSVASLHHMQAASELYFFGAFLQFFCYFLKHFFIIRSAWKRKFASSDTKS